MTASFQALQYFYTKIVFNAIFHAGLSTDFMEGLRGSLQQETTAFGTRKTIFYLPHLTQRGKGFHTKAT